MKPIEVFIDFSLKESSPTFKKKLNIQDILTLLKIIKHAIENQEVNIKKGNGNKNIDFMNKNNLSDIDVCNILYDLKPENFRGVLFDYKNPKNELYLFTAFDEKAGDIYIKVSFYKILEEIFPGVDVVSFHELTSWINDQNKYFNRKKNIIYNF